MVLQCSVSALLAGRISLAALLYGACLVCVCIAAGFVLLPLGESGERDISLGIPVFQCTS